MTRTALALTAVLSAADIAALYWLPAIIGFSCAAALAFYWCRTIDSSVMDG